MSRSSTLAIPRVGRWAWAKCQAATFSGTSPAPGGLGRELPDLRPSRHGENRDHGERAQIVIPRTGITFWSLIGSRARAVIRSEGDRDGQTVVFESLVDTAVRGAGVAATHAMNIW